VQVNGSFRAVKCARGRLELAPDPGFDWDFERLPMHPVAAGPPDSATNGTHSLVGSVSLPLWPQRMLGDWQPDNRGLLPIIRRRI